jgi:hypothetical protein
MRTNNPVLTFSSRTYNLLNGFSWIRRAYFQQTHGVSPASSWNDINLAIAKSDPAFFYAHHPHPELFINPTQRATTILFSGMFVPLSTRFTPLSLRLPLVEPSSPTMMATCRGLPPHCSLSRLVLHLLFTLLTLCLFFEILRLATFTSASPVNQLTQRREISALNDPSLYRGATDNSIASKRGTVGEDISNTFDDIVDKVKDVFKPADEKDTTAVDIVSEYAYDQVDHQIPLERLKQAFGKLHDDMERSGNETAEHDWIYHQVADTIPELRDVYEQAARMESSKIEGNSKRDDGDNPQLKPGRPDYNTLGLYNNEAPTNGNSHSTLVKRTTSPCPAISEKDNNTLIDAFNGWQKLPHQETSVFLSICEQQTKAYENEYASLYLNPHRVGLALEGARLSSAEMCIKSTGENPICMNKLIMQWPIEGCVDQLATDGKIAAKLTIGQTFKNDLAAAFTQWRADIAKNDILPCPSREENACDKADNALAFGPNGTAPEERQHLLEMCISYLGRHETCFERYQAKEFLKPHLQELAADGKIKGYSKGDNGDKPRPQPGDPDYYTSPGFFPYPMPPTLVIAEDLKTSLGNAFNEWQASIAHGHPTCTNGLGTCNEADSITTKTDYTPIDERKKKIEACIEDLIEHPNCFEGYYSRDVLKPYLTELVDQGKIKDEDGKIKKVWRR